MYHWFPNPELLDKVTELPAQIEVLPLAETTGVDGITTSLSVVLKTVLILPTESFSTEPFNWIVNALLQFFVINKPNDLLFSLVTELITPFETTKSETVGVFEINSSDTSFTYFFRPTKLSLTILNTGALVSL